MVDGLVLLALRRVDPELAEQGVHAEGPRLVGDDRHDPLTEAFVADQVAKEAGEGHRGGDGLAGGALVEVVEHAVGRQGQRPANADDAPGERAVERPATLGEVLVLGGVLGGPVVRGLLGLERRPRGSRLGGPSVARSSSSCSTGHLLDLVGGVAAFESGPEGPALDGLGQDHRGRPRCARPRPCRRHRACGSRGRPGAGCAARRRTGARPCVRSRGSGPKKCSRM